MVYRHQSIGRSRKKPRGRKQTTSNEIAEVVRCQTPGDKTGVLWEYLFRPNRSESSAAGEEPVRSHDRRREERRHSAVPARVRLRSGPAGDAFILDLSKHGCRIFHYQTELKSKILIEVWLGDTGPVKARVVWSNCQISGIEFLQPLNQSIVETLSSI